MFMLKYYRDAAGLSQKQVADYLGILRQRYANLFAYTNLPCFFTVKHLEVKNLILWGLKNNIDRQIFNEPLLIRIMVKTFISANKNFSV